MGLEVPLRVCDDTGTVRRAWPVTRGVPVPPGALSDLHSVRVVGPDGSPVPGQFRVLSRWPDGSLKWVLCDFQVDLPAGGEAVYNFCTDREIEPPEALTPVRIEEADDRITVCTGPLRFAVSRKRFSLFEYAQLGRPASDGTFDVEREVAGEGHTGDAWVRISESHIDDEGNRYIYGMGGDCRASLAEEAYSVTVEEAGPLRAVIRCEGAFEADILSHHYAGYRPFRYVTRIYAYSGQSVLRVLHTVIVACNVRETEVEEIALRVPASLGAPACFRLASRLPVEGSLEQDESLLLSQRRDNHFCLERRTGERVRRLAEGERTEGWVTVEDECAGIGVGLRYMPEEYPKALGISGSGDGIDVYLWRDPDGQRLDFRRYSEVMSWHHGEGVYADGTGSAKTSELFICFYGTSEREDVPERLGGWLVPPQVSVDPTWMAQCEVTGGFASFKGDRFPESERMLAGFVDWLERNIRLGRWYGFHNWGDVLAVWEASANDWRFYGRWGWCNSEWDPRHGLWIQHLRTGDGRIFPLAEAMTRHSMDVDTCHFHPVRPYMAGGSYRHSVDHFGDEPCASHTFIDNWVDYYYLTGDLRTFEVIGEAGEFFLRYRWTEDPAHSFSLRSIANALRGLLYAYEVTGEARFKERADAVYSVIARGQNEDGSWHKRFQVSTPDRLPNQTPFGMATEGTTLAVEMGTAPPFTDAELRKVKQHRESLTPIFPPDRLKLPPGRGDEPGDLVYTLSLDQQKGYQTHYLLIGLELLHRMTGREDVEQVYLRAVDWFCGYPGEIAADRAILQRYGGVVCRHLGYAYRLTGNRTYLDIGRKVLRELIERQDWGEDPKRHGAVELSPTVVSLLFFGVPYLLGAMADAGMGEVEGE